MAEPQGSGEVLVDITLEGGGPVFFEVENTTNGAVVFQPPSPAIGDFALNVQRGTYTFFFRALNFTFAVDAVTWVSIGHRNLAWVRVSDTEVAMSNLNFVNSQQTVQFFFNPQPEFAQVLTRKIDPTIINDPPPGVLLVEPVGEPTAVAARA